MRTIKLWLLASAIAISLAVSGCKVEPEPGAADYVMDGWEMMYIGSYQAAIGYFAQGADLDPEYADAWNGLGWAYGRLGRADTSVIHFSIGVELENPDHPGTEILAGRSFPNLALGEFESAISDAKSALERAPVWVFRRDPTFTFRHLNLNIATAFFGLGQFDSSLVWVQRLDRSFLVDVNTLPGRSLLAIKLEDLKRDL